MSKEDFGVKLTTKDQVKPLLDEHHYLSKIQRGFKSGYNYALYYNGDVVGACLFTGIPVKELLKGMLGGNFNDSQDGLFELSRLVIHPDVQESEYNITSWFVARSIRQLRKDTDVKLILSYADNDYHKGTIYKALGFDYYGLTDKKKDFFFELEDGTFKKHSRGSVKGCKGEWRLRSQKHRFLKVYDKKLDIKWRQYGYHGEN